jgi:hypothetical protein
MSDRAARAVFWRDHWQAWAESGVSQRAYCTQHGLCYATFSYWRQRAQPVGSAAAPVFVPAVMEGLPAPQALVAVPGERTGIELRLSAGRTIVVTRGFDEAELARVIRVLERTPC